ncbi:MAG: HemK2/MTQ2 family protein methyltransferase [Candidatus Diapherotrites archaeon]
MKRISLENIPFSSPQKGYAPREDSWLLAHHLPNAKGKKCLDMGCGSGIQTAALLVNEAEEVWCVDINQDALEKTKKIVEKYFPGKKTHYVQSNLFETILNEKFDIIVFNPPYVPSEKIKWMEVDGGKKGREIIDAFIEKIPYHLNEKGECYLLQSSLNGIPITEKKIRKHGMNGVIIARQKIAFEELIIFRISKNNL